MIGLDMRPVGLADIVELTRPKSSGQPVNANVVYVSKEPKPDFRRMQEVLSQPEKRRVEEQAAPDPE